MTVEVHHVAEGPDDGPLVVLSASLGSDLRMWRAQASALADVGYRVVRYDHRGHGGSPVPPGPYTLDELGADALALLDRLGAARVHWVGLSLGGMVGMWLAEQAPERLARLVLCCTSAKFGPREMWEDRIAAVRAGGTAGQAGPAVERWFTKDFRTANPDVVALAQDMVTGTPDEGYLGCCAAIRDMDLTQGLPSIGAPTLVIAGAQDKSTPPDHAERITSAVPGARLKVLDPGAHLVAVERADRVTELIIDHLGDLT
ncbi:3-oxoadipate enol-lactonase [Labedaea rhizosphaerae]|uniref:3-oxoadipate enol-lactonase n=1 Tax=Labedaea rhizosphaerae TaxID=598644 RepID=A0A4R6SK82_LABRH|nr:3-oxoadipate enol-lactonase [Labedaea rhizosphaerae]TDQ01438.1 3-oxoadipate enol-lactonase [Labedaea rhizosphaerae]